MWRRGQEILNRWRKTSTYKIGVSEWKDEGKQYVWKDYITGMAYWMTGEQQWEENHNF